MVMNDLKICFYMFECVELSVTHKAHAHTGTLCVIPHTQETQASSGSWHVNRPSEKDTPDLVRS